MSSVSRFKFVSPGISLKEIDKSKTPTEAPRMGPVIIGRAVKGPGMRPVRVDSYADFVEMFGEPIPGGEAGDIWRKGMVTAPTYGAYAAKAYLANNGPATFVRLLGFQSTTAVNDTGYAGWKLANDLSTAATASNGGAYGLFIAPIVGSGDTFQITGSNGNAKLAAVFYVNKGAVGLVGRPLNGASETISGTGSVWVRSFTDGKPEFKIKIVEPTAGTTSSVSFNFDPTSKNFIRNKLNTNPTLVNSAITTTVRDYFLGETFENIVSEDYPTTANSATNSYAAVIVALKGTDSADNTDKTQGSFKKAAVASETGWIVSQHKGTYSAFTANATTGEYPVQKLFKFVSLTEGEWNQSNIKISISDIKPSPTPYEPYGSFTVTVRDMKDDDQTQKPLEVFTNLDLNPASADYIAKRIGDAYTTWDEDKKLYLEKGTYPNLSKYIRVEMDPEFTNAGEDALPFGFYGPKKFKNISISGSSATQSVITASAFVKTAFINSANTSANSISGNYNFTGSLVFPTLPVVDTIYPGDASNDSTATTLDLGYFGMKTKQPANKLFNGDIVEILRTKPLSVSDTSGLLTYSFMFSLDDVAFSGSATDVSLNWPPAVAEKKFATWAEGNRASGKSATSKTSLAGDFTDPDFQKVARFTLPLVGGFSGFDITEKEPFSERSNSSLGSPTNTTVNETTSYAYHSIKTAIEAVADPEVVEMDVVTIPGIQNVKLTNRLLEVSEQRGDALAIIDLPGDFKSAFESTAEVVPSVATTISNLKNRRINTSYGCTFFPAVLAKDTSAVALLGMPSSVVALGVLGSSAAATDVWFAPAGFNRGGLSNGAAGFPVVGVKAKLTSKDRDNLYEVNINPIASFPAEGIVIFGQKTLQATASSLDRINVRRLMIYVKKEISRFASTLLFDPNTAVTWARFTGQVVPFLAGVKQRFGLTDFKVVLDETTTTPELVDRNILYAKIFLKPARAIEFIALDFILTNTGASFDD